MSPLCFVLMPFGTKADPCGGAPIDFDRVYQESIAPAITDAGLDPVRADHEITGGIIHKPMFERLLLCDFAVADLTTANANVFYELGVRHAVRPHTTLPIFAEGQRIPFDVGLVRALPYKLGPGNEFRSTEIADLRTRLTSRLLELRKVAHEVGAPDSPLLQLLQGYQAPDLAHLRTDLVEQQLVSSAALRRQIAAARAQQPLSAAAEALMKLERDLGDPKGVEAGVLIDIYISYRAVGAFDAMLTLYDRLPKALRSAVLVREQRAFALNRKAAKLAWAEREVARAEAQTVLEEVIVQHGANAETCGLLGRVHKDRWDELRATSPDEARGWLERAIGAYRQGFEADWRDSYPGINLATLLELEGSPASLHELERILPVVRYSAQRRAQGSTAAYWDHATLIEASILASDMPEANQHLGRALGCAREYWEPDTTARNLGLVCDARQRRGIDVRSIAKVIGKLRAKSTQLGG